MGRLAGSKYKAVIRKLRGAGFEFDRQAKGSHEIWINLDTHKRVTIPNHPGDIQESTLRAILKASGLEIEEFLGL